MNSTAIDVSECPATGEGSKLKTPESLGQSKGLRSFAELISEEDKQLSLAQGQKNSSFVPVIAQPGSAQEPWIAFTDKDRVGLALSGGGIRSATFNLGLLQALRQKRLLELIDYLSTVSGGGYVGGFWTAWRNQLKPTDPQGQQKYEPLLFPKQIESADKCPTSPKDIRERPEIRHLREFSRFLMPRVGFANAETWNGIVAVLCGMIPSITVTFAVIGLSMSVWLFLNVLFLYNRWAGAGIMFAFSLSIHLIFENIFERRKAAEKAEFDSNKRWVVAVGLSVISAALILALCWLAQLGTRTDFPIPWENVNWIASQAYPFFIPPLAWLITSLFASFSRLFFNRQAKTDNWRGTYVALAFDRGIARCLAPAVVWITLAVLWLLACYVSTQFHNSLRNEMKLSGGTTAIFAGLFTALRKWLIKPVQATNWQTLLTSLKPILPQVMAYGAVAALSVCVSEVLLRVLTYQWIGGAIFAGFCLFIMLTALWLFDPANVGLHEFYRRRIARCFLGAANPDAIGKLAYDNRQTDERQKDDFKLSELPEEAEKAPDEKAENEEKGPDEERQKLDSFRLRPIHLVCCTANNLAGDTLGTLYRGARSCVLSQRGVSLGNETDSLPDLRFSSALTASAAAFNSNMGSISMYLGLPVAFLMTGLNLRLGLWVPHPRNPVRTERKSPGAFFFREMFALTYSDSPPPGETAGPKDLYPPAPRDPKKDSGLYLHLSDGGHFENFGFYELIRRHCRYIIISDCGADPNYSFDDLANAVRRVREDFGVEIELDIDPLKPDGSGYCKQHVVTGVIHYDGVTGCDKGSIIYFKPTLTGNEPPDVLQYKVRNPVFPQEPTSDQFYDEAQWESYRRLGEHCGHECFRFVENLKPGKVERAESVFHFAVQQWQPGWPQQDEWFLNLTARCAELEGDVRDQAPAFLRAEFFPEIAESPPPAPVNAAANETVIKEPPKLDDEIRAVYFLMMAIQIMEDAWLACRLDSQWAHPLNMGWMNYFQRWASTPTFRRWWCILKPIYSPAFYSFAEQQFNLKIEDITDKPEAIQDLATSRLLMNRVSVEVAKNGMIWKQWERTLGHSISANEDLAVFTYELLPATCEGQRTTHRVQVGIALIKEDLENKTAEWTTSDFFVPPALNGAGFIYRFLDSIIARYKSEGKIKILKVQILDQDQKADAEPRRDPVSRGRRLHLIDFYKTRQFKNELSKEGSNRLSCSI